MSLECTIGADEDANEHLSGVLSCFVRRAVQVQAPKCVQDDADLAPLLADESALGLSYDDNELNINPPTPCQ